MLLVKHNVKQIKQVIPFTLIFYIAFIHIFLNILFLSNVQNKETLETNSKKPGSYVQSSNNDWWHYNFQLNS